MTKETCKSKRNSRCFSVDGHDSLEDASAAMELMIWKVKDDIKHNRVKL